MRSLAPRPILLLVTLALVAGAIAFVELRSDATGPVATSARKNPNPPAARGTVGTTVQKEKAPAPRSSDRKNQPSAQRADGNDTARLAPDTRRISRKEKKYERAPAITGATGSINTNGTPIKEAAKGKVVLVQFWTYSCINCQHAQPHINALYDKYRNEGLLVVGVHSPEFGFEKDFSSVREAVKQEGIRYPVVLDNNHAIWNAYGQRFWPAWYLVDSDGFIRYRHFGEGAYDETGAKIRELLAERDSTSD